MDQIVMGLHAERVVTVTEDMTARNLGSGQLPVYSTAAMIALMEAASIEAIEHLLPPGQASVGTAFTIEHFAATPIGDEVRAQAEVIEVEGPKVVFEVRAWDGEDLIGEGTHVRFIIVLARLMGQLSQNNARSGEA